MEIISGELLRGGTTRFMREQLLILRWQPGLGWGDLSVVASEGKPRLLRLVCLDPVDEPDMVELTQQPATHVNTDGACEAWFLGRVAESGQPAT